MYYIISGLILIFLTDRGYSQLSLENTPCPSVCVCNGEKVTCEGHLRYIYHHCLKKQQILISPRIS